MLDANTIASFFVPQTHIIGVKPFCKGLINSSWIIHCDKDWNPGKIFLQRMNRHVFKHPEHIIENLQVLHAHIASLPEPKANARTLLFPDLIPTLAGTHFHIDETGEYWRAFQYMQDTQTLDYIQTPLQAREIGYVVGRFHALLCDIDLDQLTTTLPDFHITPNYLKAFDLTYRQSQHSQSSTELQKCLVLIEQFRDCADRLELARQSNHLPTRLIHGDPKRDNILFDKHAQQAISLIDLDTMQPGLIHYDIGDCLRSCCGTVIDREKQFSEMQFDLEIFEPLLDSYLQQTQKFIQPIEYNWFYDAILLIPFELGLRFLTDYLNGNIYFKIDHPQQNLQKALQQFTLVADIESRKGFIQSTIQQLKSKYTNANQATEENHFLPR
ncbi:MAG TPA: aminoglycoside phosphotransferase family protein [Crenotrichaceae bacterium]|nr:aminoglycoside phosphotransferase family protein [Crenotrichaceae bacterium]